MFVCMSVCAKGLHLIVYSFIRSLSYLFVMFFIYMYSWLQSRRFRRIELVVWLLFTWSGFWFWFIFPMRPHWLSAATIAGLIGSEFMFMPVCVSGNRRKFKICYLFWIPKKGGHANLDFVVHFGRLDWFLAIVSLACQDFRDCSSCCRLHHRRRRHCCHDALNPIPYYCYNYFRCRYYCNYCDRRLIHRRRCRRHHHHLRYCCCPVNRKTPTFRRQNESHFTFYVLNIIFLIE